MCHSKGNASLNSEAITFLSLLLLSCILSKVDPIFALKARAKVPPTLIYLLLQLT